MSAVVEFFADLALSLWDAIVWLLEFVWVFIKWLVSLAEAFWIWYKDLVVTVWSELWEWFSGKLEEYGVGEFLFGANWGMDGPDGSSWVWWLQALVDVQWILPVGGMLGILSSAYTACALIRMLRWAKSFVPTISGS